MITQNLTLNLIPSGVLPRLNVSQYDKGQTVAVTLNNGSVPFSLPSGATVYVSGTKADNTGFEYACSTSGGVSFTIKDQMTVFAGEVTCELSIYQGNNRLSTINFILNVEKAALSEDTEISQTDIPIIENIPQYVTQAANSANLAHQWATGGGSDTPSATNNAKYWAEQAAQTDIGRATTVGYSTDQSPYSFRRCTHNAVYDKLVGISWVKNQLVPIPATSKSTTSGNLTVTDNRDGSYTVEGTPSSTQLVYLKSNGELIGGHKYAVQGMAGKTGVAFFNAQGSSVNTDKDTVFAATTTKRIDMCLAIRNTFDGTRTTVKPQLVDLTAMFGNPAIADKIYTMEQATAGSGLTWIRQYGFLDGDYIEYNAGAIESSAPTYRKVVGFNQWDEEWELGTYNSSGVKTSSTINICTKNAFNVFPNTEYYFHCGASGLSRFVNFYDADGAFISQVGLTAIATFTTPSNAVTATFFCGSAYGTVYNHDICINISDPTKNGTYEPYKEITYPLGGDELRGVPQLVGDDLVADGDVKTSDGVVNSRYAEYIFTGNETWIGYGSGFQTDVLSSKPAVTFTSGLVPNAISDIGLLPISRENLYSGASGFAVNETKILVSNKDNLAGKKILYPLATPTSSVSTPFTSPQVSLETEETDTICGHDSVVVDIPEWMQTEYFDDVRADASKVQGVERNLGEIECDKTTAGTYTLSCTVDSSGNKTYSWA